MSKTMAEKRIFKAAESLSDEIYRQSKTLIQPEDLTCWIRCHMELRPEEQEEEFEVDEKQSQSRNESPAKSVANELRQALGRPDISLFDLTYEADTSTRRMER